LSVIVASKLVVIIAATYADQIAKGITGALALRQSAARTVWTFRCYHANHARNGPHAI
jgi:hypothetical protein